MQSALILEDHADTRIWLSELLTQAFPGISCTLVSTLAAAGKAIAESKFSLAVIDINLPDGSGIDFLRAVKGKNPETYCVVATIYDDDDHVFAALQAGADGYLLKEQARPELLRRLQGIINGEPPLSPVIARRVLRHFHQKAARQASEKLSEREQEVLTLIAKGLNRTEVAAMLGISANTAAGHVKMIYQKLDISSRAEATLEASRMGLVSPD